MVEVGFLRALESRRAELEQLEPAWRLVDDVLASRVKAKGSEGWWSSYFPKGRLEPASEYSLRVELTPFFPQTPGLLAARLGALFRTKLRVEVTSSEGSKKVASPVRGQTGRSAPPTGLEAADEAQKALSTLDGEVAFGSPHPALPPVVSALSPAGREGAAYEFLRRAGRRHQSFEDIAVQAACLAQSHGFCAALIDRDPLPADLDGRVVSQAEAAARGLGRAYIALYGAPQVLDWDFGSDGRLSWVKFVENETARASWDSPAEQLRTVRIVDRVAIRVYRLRRDAKGVWSCEAAEPVEHGFNGRVPVVFLHPFPGADGIGRPILQRAAEADIASARILSDLVWDLFLLGNPILTLKTNRNEQDLGRLGVGASRYIPLRNGRPGEENAEALEFVQLDPTGIELLFRAHALFASQARAQAGGGEDAAAVPREQSGISQAWKFKTGEERVLFMLARALEPFLTECAELGLEAEGRRWGNEGDITAGSPHFIPAAFASLTSALSPTGREGRLNVIVRLPESFDVAASQETIATAERLVGLAEKLGQTALARTALERVEAVLGALAPETRTALKVEREGMVI